MEMMKKMFNFIENYENPFFVGSLVKNKVIYVNQKARKTFDITAETCDYEKIFSTSNQRLRDIIAEHVTTVSQSLLYNCTVTKADGETMLVDIQLGFFDDEKTEIFMEMISRKDVSKKMALFQVEKANRPEAILEYDDNLTLYHCNDLFYNLFSSIKETFYDLYQNKLANVFLPHKKETLLEDILQQLHESENYSVEIQVLTASGDKKWVILDLQRRNFDQSGEKLMCSLTSIDERKNTAQKLNTFSQYFEAMQTLSGESLYQIDVKTRVLRQKGAIAKELGMPEEVGGYPEGAYPLIHPEDLDQFKEFAEKALAGENRFLQARIMNSTGDYNWYTLHSMVIYDETGEVFEILGKMKNIHAVHELKTEHTLLNQYLSAMQELSDDILYRIDVETMTLYRLNPSDQMNLVGKAIPDYVNTLIDQKLIHPEEASAYRKFVNDWYSGGADDFSARFSIDGEDYQWYSMKGKKIFNEIGDLTEVFGKMVNIEKEHKLRADYSLLNQYFNAMQALSDDILYRVDVKTMTLYHMVQSGQADRLGNVIPDYVNAFIRDKIIHPDDCDLYLQASQEWFQGTRDTIDIRAAIISEEYQWYVISGEKIYDEEGNLSEILGKMVNIQEQKDLKRKATHDLMTNVLNKVSFEETVSNILSFSHNQEKHALIFIDLDDFKGINDTLGHFFGDSLLISVGERLKSVVRDSDFVGRVGGDEFVVFLKGIPDESAALERANLLLDSLRREFIFEGTTRKIKASLGISIFPEHGSTYQDLIKKSDVALYASKKKGKNVATIFIPER